MIPADAKYRHIKFSSVSFSVQYVGYYPLRNRVLSYGRAKRSDFRAVTRRSPKGHLLNLSASLHVISNEAKKRLIHDRLISYLGAKQARYDTLYAREAEWLFMWDLFLRLYDMLDELLPRLEHAEDRTFVAATRAAYAPHVRRYDSELGIWPDLAFVILPLRVTSKSGKVYYCGLAKVLRAKAFKIKENESVTIYYWAGLPVPELALTSNPRFTIGMPSFTQKLDTRRYQGLLPYVTVSDNATVSYALAAIFTALQTIAYYFQCDFERFVPAVLAATQTLTLVRASSHLKALHEQYYIDNEYDYRIPNMHYQALRDILEPYRQILQRHYPNAPATTPAADDDAAHNAMIAGRVRQNKYAQIDCKKPKGPRRR